MTTALGIGTRNRSVHEPLVRAPRGRRAMAEDRKKLPGNASDADVRAFLRQVAETPAPCVGGARGRLIFAMDATASREPAWDRACHIQGEMFAQTAALGGLDVQLVYYRGFREFGASAWLSNTEELLQRMTSVFCLGGYTQIARVLRHALAETAGRKVNALVFVGDCMEEDRDELCQLAGELGLLALPAFIFHEGDDAAAGRAFREIARLSGGAYCRFDATSARQLRELLSAVAVYAAGGWHALEGYGQRTGGLALQVTHQIAKR